MIDLAALLGGAGGALLRLAPDVLKFLDRKNERAHELKLQEFELQRIDKEQAGRLAIADREARSAELTQAIGALTESVKAQATATGIRWVDALSSSVRPVVTYLIVLMWMAVKVAAFAQLQGRGISWDQAILTLWGPEDVTMLSGVLTFWFVGRVLDRIK